MKSYEEMARDVLIRRDEALAEGIGTKSRIRWAKVIPIAAVIGVLLAGSVTAAVILLKPGENALPVETNDTYPEEFKIDFPGKGEITLYAGSDAERWTDENGMIRGANARGSRAKDIIGADITTPVNDDSAFKPVYHDSEGNRFYLDPPMIRGGEMIGNSKKPQGETVDVEERCRRAEEFMRGLYDMPENFIVVPNFLSNKGALGDSRFVTAIPVAEGFNLYQGGNIIVRDDGEVLSWEYRPTEQKEFDVSLLEGITWDYLNDSVIGVCDEMYHGKDYDYLLNIRIDKDNYYKGRYELYDFGLCYTDGGYDVCVRVQDRETGKVSAAIGSWIRLGENK